MSPPFGGGLLYSAAMATVALANVNPGLVRAEFAHTLVKLLTDNPGQLKTILITIGGCLVHLTRNIAVDRFLESTDADWLWFVDSDIAFEPSMMGVLLHDAEKNDCPAIAHSYPMVLDKTQNYHSIFQFDDAGMAQPVFKVEDNVPPLVECQSTGMGCTMLRRDLLERLHKETPHVFQQGLIDNVLLGEDHWFFKHWDIHPLVRTDQPIIHVKSNVLKLNYPRKEDNA
jgi:hypothetical protein